MATDNYLNPSGVQETLEWIKSQFVQVQDGKGLSTKDFTEALQQKLVNLEQGAQKNIIEVIKRNNTVLQPDANKAVNISVPTALSQLLNDKDYQTAAQVQASINAARQNLFKPVATLPTTGEANYIYVTYNSTTQEHEEWHWVQDNNGVWGWDSYGMQSGSVDFSAYLKKEELTPMTTTQIQDIIDTVMAG